MLPSKIMNVGVPPDENFSVLQLLNFGETYKFCKAIRSYRISEPFNLLCLLKSEEHLENVKPALFRPRSIHSCQQKPNLSGEPVSLNGEDLSVFFFDSLGMVYG